MVEEELEVDPLQQVMATTLKEELSPPSLEDVVDYFTQADEEIDILDFEKEAKPESSPVELKQLPARLKYVFLNGNRRTPVIISDKQSEEETQKLVTTLEKYRSVIGYSL